MEIKISTQIISTRIAERKVGKAEDEVDDTDKN
jgi:hypothetical protein